MGVPFAANPMHGSMYPPVWISALVPGSYGADLVIVLHVAFLGLGVAALSRRLGANSSGAFAAGAIVMASGYVASMAQNGVPLLTLAWIPWIACGACAVAGATPCKALLRATRGLAALLGLAILSGDPAGAISGGLLALVLILVRSERRWSRVLALAAASLGAVLLAAVVVLPALHLMGEGSRAGGLAAGEAVSWSMHPLQMLEWAWPQMLGDATEPKWNLARAFANSSVDASMGPSWSLSVFLGVPVLALLFLARQRSLLLASLVFVILAVGSYTPIYELYRAAFPLEQVIRFPARHWASALILWSALAGVGWTQWQRSEHHAAWTRGLWGACALFGVMAVVSLAARGSISGALSDRAALLSLDAAGAWRAASWGALVAAISILVFSFASRLIGSEHRRKLACGLAATAILVPLCRESLRVQPLVDRDLVSGTPALLRSVLGSRPKDGPRPRLYRNRLTNPRVGDESRAIVAAGLYHTAKPNMGTAAGMAYVPGYDPSLSNRLRSMWDEGASMGSRLLQLFDIEYVLMPMRSAQGSGMRIIAPALDPGLVLAQQENRRPRAFVATRWNWVASDASARARLFATEKDLHSIDLIGEGVNSGSGAELVPCAVVTVDPDEVALECTSPSPGYAVLLDAWAPGWTATVNGEPAEVLRAEALVRAVAVEAGDQRIAFRYRTPGLRLGLLLSAGGWLLWLLGLVGLRFSGLQPGPPLPEEERREQA